MRKTPSTVRGEADARSHFAYELTRMVQSAPVAMPVHPITADDRRPEVYWTTGMDNKPVALEFDLDAEHREITVMASRGGAVAMAARFADDVAFAISDAVNQLVLGVGEPA